MTSSARVPALPALRLLDVFVSIQMESGLVKYYPFTD